MQQTKRQQSAPTLRRKKKQQDICGGICNGENNALLVPLLVLVGFVVLGGGGLVFEFGREQQSFSLPAETTKDSASAFRRQKEIQQQEQDEHEHGSSNENSDNTVWSMLHLQPLAPVLPIFAPVPNAESLIDDLLTRDKPTMAGIIALFQKHLREMHTFNRDFGKKYEHGAGHGMEIIEQLFSSTKEHLGAFDEACKSKIDSFAAFFFKFLTQVFMSFCLLTHAHTDRGKPIFPVRQDGSIYLSLAAYREHLLADTMEFAFTQAKNPEKLFIGAVVQNCFGRVLDDGVTIETDGLPCRTGVQVVGKNENGSPKIKMSDAPVDKNGIEDFCKKPDFKKYCDNGQVRVLYVHETERYVLFHSFLLWCSLSCCRKLETAIPTNLSLA
jgi:hypothetical protein